LKVFLLAGCNKPHHNRDETRERQSANFQQGKKASPDLQHHRQKDTE